jgi:hypothetical protein
MKKEEIPHDLSPLGKITKELCYAVDETGKYTTELSEGWEVKSGALDVAWDDVGSRISRSKQRVLDRQASPLLYFMELKLMDVPIVAAYTGLWKWQVKRHLKPSVFMKLADRTLQRYAEVFECSVQDIKTMNVHEA